MSILKLICEHFGTMIHGSCPRKLHGYFRSIFIDVDIDHLSAGKYVYSHAHKVSFKLVIRINPCRIWRIVHLIIWLEFVVFRMWWLHRLLECSAQLRNCAPFGRIRRLRTDTSWYFRSIWNWNKEFIFNNKKSVNDLTIHTEKTQPRFRYPEMGRDYFQWKIGEQFSGLTYTFWSSMYGNSKHFIEGQLLWTRWFPVPFVRILKLRSVLNDKISPTNT